MDPQELEKRKKELSEDQVDVCFFKGTEPPFSGKYTNNKRKGTYSCVVCGTPLFHSERKYASWTGWPAFDDPIDPKNIKQVDDFSYGMHRVELQCAKCDAHLGHVFPDGPKETTGQRYCVNSLALDFKEA